MNKCPNCKKTFVDISEGCREILGCPKCGLYKVDAERVVANKQQRAPVTTPAAQPVKSEWTEDCEWMRRLTKKIASEHGELVRVTWGTANSWCQPSRDNKPARIHYGADAIQRDRTNGFTEYVTQGWLWRDLANTKTVRVHTGWTRTGNPSYSRYVQTDLTGRKGLWAQVLHEFAHTVGHRHDSTWASKVQELQALYPYNECQNI